MKIPDITASIEVKTKIYVVADGLSTGKQSLTISRNDGGFPIRIEADEIELVSRQELQVIFGEEAAEGKPDETGSSKAAVQL
jgi:hypothetical protein